MQLRTAQATLEKYWDEYKNVYWYTVKKKITYESTGVEILFDWLVHEQTIVWKKGFLDFVYKRDETVIKDWIRKS